MWDPLTKNGDKFSPPGSEPEISHVQDEYLNRIDSAMGTCQYEYIRSGERRALQIKAAYILILLECILVSRSWTFSFNWLHSMNSQKVIGNRDHAFETAIGILYNMP